MEGEAFIEGVRLLWCEIHRTGARGQGRAAEREAVAALVSRAFPDKGFTVSHRANGAPFLPGYTGTISISHSLTHALVGIDTLGRAMGVDVECSNRREQLMRVCPRFLSDGQQAHGAPYPDYLLTAWTQKEALYKALGMQGVDFRSLPVSWDWGEVEYAGRHFQLLPLYRIPGCQGALAVERL